MKTYVLAITIILLAAAHGALAQDSVDVARAENFYKMTKAAPAAFNAGEYEKAIEISRELLVEAENWKKDWNYGNAIHAANLVQGRVALRRGEIDDAKKFLLAAGKASGSPTLISFGPDMLFAKEMLKRSEQKIVLTYFDLCAKFWLPEHSRIPEWKEAVERGEIPDFGPNVAYVFGSAR
jgi:hypothetical protein